MQTDPVVKTDPIMEAVARCLSGISGVPKDEQMHMVHRAVKATRKAADTENKDLCLRITRLSQAIAFYADPGTYYGKKMRTDRSMTVHGKWYGKRARSVLPDTIYGEGK